MKKMLSHMKIWQFFTKLYVWEDDEEPFESSMVLSRLSLPQCFLPDSETYTGQVYPIPLCFSPSNLLHLAANTSLICGTTKRFELESVIKCDLFNVCRVQILPANLLPRITWINKEWGGTHTHADTNGYIKLCMTVCVCEAYKRQHAIS